MSLFVQPNRFLPALSNVGSFFFGSSSRTAFTSLCGVSALSLLALAWKTANVRSMLSHKFEFASWNIGRFSDFAECLQKNRYSHSTIPLPQIPEGPAMSDAESKAVEARRLDLITQRIIEDGSSIFAIQELSREDLGNDIFREWLPLNHFSFVFDGTDTAVLFRSDLFEEDVSERRLSPEKSGRTSTQIVLRHWETGTKIAVGSAHISGFSLGNTPEQRNEREAQFGHREGRAYHGGDRELLSFVGELSETAGKDSIDFTLFGADINTNPSIVTEQQFSISTSSGGSMTCPQRTFIPTELYGFVRPTEVNDGQSTGFNRHLGETSLDQVYAQQNPNRTQDRILSLSARSLAPHIDPPSDHKIIHISVQFGPSFWKTLLHVVGLRPLDFLSTRALSEENARAASSSSSSR